MNSLDIFLAIFILFYGLLGYVSGFLRSFLGIVVVLLSIYLSSNFSHVVLSSFGFLGEASKSAYPVLFLFLFLLLYLLGEILLSFVKRVIKVVILGPLDGLCGMIASGIRGILLLGVIFQIILKLPISSAFRAVISDSIIIGYSQEILVRVYPFVVSKMPEVETFFKEKFADTVNDNDKFAQIKMFASFEAFPKLKNISLPQLK
jgi:uncharacterized membrane protein required for colicin V production